jgi:hypothetical protein
MRSSLARLAVLVLLACLGGCHPQNPASFRIGELEFRSGGDEVDMSLAFPDNWRLMCVLGPYANNAAVMATLGFSWDAEGRTSIAHNDGIALLLFVEGQTVTNHLEHPRGSGDFTHLSGKCFRREDAQFVYVPSPAPGWPGYFSRKPHKSG